VTSDHVYLPWFQVDLLNLWMAYKEAKALLRLETAPAAPSKPNGQ
jgi:hypothetical protein